PLVRPGGPGLGRARPLEARRAGTPVRALVADPPAVRAGLLPGGGDRLGGDLGGGLAAGGAPVPPGLAGRDPNQPAADPADLAGPAPGRPDAGPVGDLGPAGGPVRLGLRPGAGLDRGGGPLGDG